MQNWRFAVGLITVRQRWVRRQRASSYQVGRLEERSAKSSNISFESISWGVGKL